MFARNAHNFQTGRLGQIGREMCPNLATRATGQQDDKDLSLKKQTEKKIKSNLLPQNMSSVAVCGPTPSTTSEADSVTMY